MELCLTGSMAVWERWFYLYPWVSVTFVKSRNIWILHTYNVPFEFKESIWNVCVCVWVCACVCVCLCVCVCVCACVCHHISPAADTDVCTLTQSQRYKTNPLHSWLPEMLMRGREERNRCFLSNPASSVCARLGLGLGLGLCAEVIRIINTVYIHVHNLYNSLCS